MNDLEIIKRQADDKVQLFLDLNNREHPLQQELKWGPYIVYLYLHTEEYLEEIVTFEDKDEAEAYLQSILDGWEKDPTRDSDPWGDEDPNDWEKEYLSIKSWDEPIRRGTHRYYCETVGLANPEEFVKAMPTKMAMNLMVELFYSSLIPGYFEEH